MTNEGLGPMRTSELSPSQGAELDALAAMSDCDIDTSDIPEVRELSNPRRGMFSGSPNRRAVLKRETVQRKLFDCESADRHRKSQ